MEPHFQFKDEAGKVRRVRIVKNYIEGVGRESFKAAVADVVDVVTEEELKKIPLEKLIPLDESSS